jgi:hypothetical protein
MPLVRIEVLKGRAASDKSALLQGVHEALMAALQIPDDDRLQRLIEYDAEDSRSLRTEARSSPS